MARGHLLHIVASPHRQGVPHQLELLAGQFEPVGKAVGVCLLGPAPEVAARLRRLGWEVWELAGLHPWPVDVRTLRQLRSVVHEFQPGILHAHGLSAEILGSLLCRWLRPVHFVVTRYEAAAPAGSWMQRRLSRTAARRAAAIVTTCDAVDKSCRQQGLPETRLVRIPPGVAELENARTTSSESSIRSQLALGPDARLIFTAGCLDLDKRFKELVWATDLLKVLRDDTHLIIAGDGPLRWRVGRYVHRIRNGDRVHLLGQRYDLPQLAQQCECAWFAHHHVGLSIALLEAMAAGLPILATDTGGHRELVVAGRSGYLIPGGDRAGFARHTLGLLLDRERRTRLGNEACHQVRLNYTAGAMSERYRALYRSLG